ncbi:MAG: chromate transporter [Aquabacterium sp.]|nr:chromate transporter [Aquabacterium sp.]
MTDSPPSAATDNDAALQARAATELRRPRSLADVYRVFTRMALQGFGGVLPVAHRELVERERWMSPQGFLEVLSLSQVLPGPNVVNLAIIFGDRHFGWRGALAATAGMLSVPMLVVLVLALIYRQAADVPLVTGALRGMGVVAAGLIIGTAVKLAGTVSKNPLGLPLAMGVGVMTFAMVGLLRWPMVWVVLGLGAASMAAAWWRIVRQARGPTP